MNFSIQLGKFSLTLGGKKAKDTPIKAWLRGDDNAFASTSPALASPFQQSVWVYTAVSALAQTISSIPFRVSRGDRSGENILTTGPVVDLFNRPHPYLSRFRFWEFIVTWYCLRGEAFLVGLDKSDGVLPIKSTRQPPSRLLVLNPDHFRHVVENFDLIGWNYFTSPLSGPVPSMNFTPVEIIHDALPNPYLFWRGMSPLSVAMLAAQTDFASAQFMKGFMLNNADAGVIVRSDAQLPPEQREVLLASLRERKQSAGTADRPLLLWGATEVIQPGLSSADLQFLENRKMNRQEICAAFFRIPETLVGFSENANRAVAAAERLNFIENSITPLCARLEAAVEPIVKSFGPDLVGWFDIDSTPVLQEARRNRVDTGVKLFGLGYPPNAINKALDLGLPHLPWGEKGYLPARLQEAGEIVPKPQSSQEALGARRILASLRKVSSNQCSVFSKNGDGARPVSHEPATENEHQHATRNTQHPPLTTEY